MSDKTAGTTVDSTTPPNLASDERKRYERRAFLFLTVFVAPAIAVAVVGGYGFIVWMMHLLFGPPAS